MVGREDSVEEPLNREPPVQALVSSFLTKNDAYDRNHGAIRHLSASTHTVRVDGLVHTPLALSVTQLQQDYEQHEITCALQCAGNRRHTMRTLLKEVEGIDWGDGAVMNCRWKGPKLRDVLLTAGIKTGKRQSTGEQGKMHVAFASLQKCQDEDWYGGSIELERAMREEADVLLALEMNGEALSDKHGYPVRIIVPGFAGAKSVKWVDSITVQPEESRNHYQQRDYKILPPEAVDMKSAEKFWDSSPPIQDMPVNSVITRPLSGEQVERSAEGTVAVEGYALPQGDQGPVVRVEVSGDEGRSWLDAEIVEGKGERWCWVLWRAHVKADKGTKRFLSRATDKGGNTQEEHSEWNLRGVGYSGYGESRDVEIV
ncbi:hypothetical protein MMC26_004763 [Xylographa opegraphella]|nr:hypothetical protein [Xylographa opegraphella]